MVEMARCGTLEETRRPDGDQVEDEQIGQDPIEGINYSDPAEGKQQQQSDRQQAVAVEKRDSRPRQQPEQQQPEQQQE
jgi:hypothetical protein